MMKVQRPFVVKTLLIATGATVVIDLLQLVVSAQGFLWVFRGNHSSHSNRDCHTGNGP